MERRPVASRVLLFVAGTAAIVLLVFVALPWVETSVQEEVQPQFQDTIAEEVVASFGEEESGQGRETDGQVEAAADLSTFPSPLFPVGFESPVPGPAIEPLEATAVMTSDATPVESEQETNKEDNPASVDLPTEEARAAVDSTAEKPPSGVRIETDEQGPIETVKAEKETSPARAAPEVVDAPAPTRIEPMPVVEGVRVERIRSEEAFRRAQATRESSRAGLPKEEFEMPDDLRIVGTPSVGGDVADAGGAMTTPVGPLSEFSPRPFVRSDAPLAAEAPAADESQSDPVLVPQTLRGVMGYRLPLISRQELPDQVVSGVLIPAHTTYVILQPGYWELVGLSPDDVKALRAAAEKAKADQLAPESEHAARGWKPFRLFRPRRATADGN